eukprot:Rmarinus@m.18555
MLSTPSPRQGAKSPAKSAGRYIETPPSKKVSNIVDAFNAMDELMVEARRAKTNPSPAAKLHASSPTSRVGTPISVKGSSPKYISSSDSESAAVKHARSAPVVANGRSRPSPTYVASDSDTDDLKKTWPRVTQSRRDNPGGMSRGLPGTNKERKGDVKSKGKILDGDGKWTMKLAKQLISGLSSEEDSPKPKPIAKTAKPVRKLQSSSSSSSSRSPAPAAMSQPQPPVDPSPVVPTSVSPTPISSLPPRQPSPQTYRPAGPSPKARRSARPKNSTGTQTPSTMSVVMSDDDVGLLSESESDRAPSSPQSTLPATPPRHSRHSR